MQLVTPATCLANRGLVRLAMKRFRGAVEDLGGELGDNPKVAKSPKAPVAAGGDESGFKGTPSAVSTTGGGMTATLAGGALDCLDSELGRALAEGRLENRASREVLVTAPRSKRSRASEKCQNGSHEQLRVAIGVQTETQRQLSRIGSNGDCSYFAHFFSDLQAMLVASIACEHILRPHRLETYPAPCTPRLRRNISGFI